MARDVEREWEEDRREHQHLAVRIGDRKAYCLSLSSCSPLGRPVRGGSGGDGGPDCDHCGAGGSESEASRRVAGDGVERTEPQCEERRGSGDLSER